MPNLNKPVQQDSPKVIAVAVTQDVMSGAVVWLYALFATALAWALLQFNW